MMRPGMPAENPIRIESSLFRLSRESAPVPVPFPVPFPNCLHVTRRFLIAAARSTPHTAPPATRREIPVLTLAKSMVALGTISKGYAKSAKCSLTNTTWHGMASLDFLSISISVRKWAKVGVVPHTKEVYAKRLPNKRFAYPMRWPKIVPLGKAAEGKRGTLLLNAA